MTEARESERVRVCRMAAREALAAARTRGASEDEAREAAQVASTAAAAEYDAKSEGGRMSEYSIADHYCGQAQPHNAHIWQTPLNYGLFISTYQCAGLAGRESSDADA